MLSLRKGMQGSPRAGGPGGSARRREDADAAMEDSAMGPVELMEDDEDVAFEALLEKRVHQEYDKDFGDDFDDDNV
eukprot:CAMPEP_0181485326 /NCGR_PEP_ID=MMETSP1110-20121109/46506_1 /TAXON_ID=174948 /ORGANISM="Symbiodinium sp., Strain CCMP421" /LENGTH=75 /DNA_ID=CAMNT_0023611319 /DNA_START=78 /DNA_END=305 /DNA_ORIENTATION=-